ncbi:nuclear transport factor 2 family protein [Pseudonocardia sp. NPDC049635]|uniref:nuclear transport factor 2 family protein n=1 Tax=Pseudonocardia sp. NPDC049635 TaxID=3155506 RepID=UPI0033F0A45D
MTTGIERSAGSEAGAGDGIPALQSELMSVLTGLWFDIDHNGGADAATFFTPDAELRFSDAIVRGTAAIEQVYADRTARGPRVSRHIVTNLQVVATGADRVRAVSVLLLFGDDGEPPRPSTMPALVGDVFDEFERHDGRWLIRSRWIQNLFIEPTTELAVPQE